MPPRSRTAARSTVPDVVGSHQSQAEVAAMLPEQHAVLAAAAASTSSGKQPISARGPKKTIGKKRLCGPKKTIGKKRLFVNISTGSSSSSSSASRRRNFKGDCAVLKFMRAKYMKGEKESQLSGAVYMQGKVRYAKPATF